MKRDTRKRHAREYALTLRFTRLDLLSLISLNKFIPEYTGLVLRRRCSDNTCSIRHEDREVHFCHEDCTSRRSSSLEGVEGITYRTCDVVVIIKIHTHIGALARATITKLRIGQSLTITEKRTRSYTWKQETRYRYTLTTYRGLSARYVFTWLKIEC